MKQRPNDSMERTRASRTDHFKLASKWRLARAAHAARSAESHIIDRSVRLR